MKSKQRGLLKNTLIEHILNNKKEYFIFFLMLIIGIFLGVFFVNNLKEVQFNEVKEYFLTSIENLKQSPNLQNMEMLKTIVKRNISLSVILWFLGTTIIGIPIVLGIVVYRGFCLGYTISTSVVTLGSMKGIAFVLTSLVLHNIFFIPAIIAIGVSGFKLYIMKDKRKQNIKMEIVRHTIFSLIMTVILMISAVIETFGTTSLILLIIKYL